MPNVVIEYFCKDCGCNAKGAWSGEEAPRAIYCGRCGGKLVSTEGQQTQTHTQTKACELCEKEYTPTKSWQKYCSDRCRWQAWSVRHNQK